MATLLYPDGRKLTVQPAAATFTLDEIYEWVECSMVECVGLADGRTMWLDEEGKLGPALKQANPAATVLLRAAGSLPSDYVAGIALITDTSEAD